MSVGPRKSLCLKQQAVQHLLILRQKKATNNGGRKLYREQQNSKSVCLNCQPEQEMNQTDHV